MDSFFTRYRHQCFLAVLVVAQLMLLGYQVRRPDAGGTRLIRAWGLEATVPVGKTSQRAVLRVHGWISDYLALRQVRRQNQALTAQLTSLELANQQLQEKVREMPGIANLLAFRGSLGFQTLPAEVIGSGGSPDNQVIYLGQGSHAGLARDMPVITTEGVVGKLSQVLGGSAQVLLITDPESGIGAMVDSTSVHGIVQGMGTGRVELRFVLDDESVAVGSKLITSGEDQVFPKGLPVGTVVSVRPGPIFQQITVKPATDLGRLEQVLVITVHVAPPAEAATGLTAAEIRQAQLPAIPEVATGLAPGAGKVGVSGPPPVTPAAPVSGDAGTPPAEGDDLAPPPPAAASAAPVPAPGAGRGEQPKPPASPVGNPIHH